MDSKFSVLKTASVLCLLLTLAGCRSLTTLYFHPSNQYVHNPNDHGVSYETIELTTEDGETLVNWLFHAEGETKGRVVFFHGNAENISTHFASVYWLPKAGYEVFLLDYRGFGKSTGVPALPNVLTDLQLSYEWVQARSEEDKKPVFVLGQSIGAALTVMAMADVKQQPDCLVLDAGFDSFKDMARISFQRSWLFWSFAYPASWLLPSEFEPGDYAPRLNSTVLQFHSPTDQVIPYQQGQVLHNKFKDAKWAESSGPHIATFHNKVHRAQLLEFFEQCRSR